MPVHDGTTPFHDKILAHGRLNGPTIASQSGEAGTRGTASRRVWTDDPACPVCGGDWMMHRANWAATRMRVCRPFFAPLFRVNRS